MFTEFKGRDNVFIVFTQSQLCNLAKIPLWWPALLDQKMFLPSSTSTSITISTKVEYSINLISDMRKDPDVQTLSEENSQD